MKDLISGKMNMQLGGQKKKKENNNKNAKVLGFSLAIIINMIRKN